MRSIAFPKMFNSNSTIVVSDNFNDTKKSFRTSTLNRFEEYNKTWLLDSFYKDEDRELINFEYEKATNIKNNATKQNLKLLVLSEAGDFFGDPEFGLRLKRYMHNQNDYVLRDLLVDELYEKLSIFMPQLIVNRKEIKIVQERNSLHASFRATNRWDFTTDMYNLNLLEEKE